MNYRLFDKYTNETLHTAATQAQCLDFASEVIRKEQNEEGELLPLYLSYGHDVFYSGRGKSRFRIEEIPEETTAKKEDTGKPGVDMLPFEALT